MVKYTPSRGDMVWLEFSPTKGHEIQKTRPAIALSPKSYHKKTDLGLFVPITSQEKGYPFEVKITFGDIQGVVLCDQVRSIDWQARKASFICALPESVVNEIMAKMMTLLE